MCGAVDQLVLQSGCVEWQSGVHKHGKYKLYEIVQEWLTTTFARLCACVRARMYEQLTSVGAVVCTSCRSTNWESNWYVYGPFKVGMTHFHCSPLKSGVVQFKLLQENLSNVMDIIKHPVKLSPIKQLIRKTTKFSMTDIHSRPLSESPSF